MDRTINVGGCEMRLRANAATPLYYRNMFRDDLLNHLGEEETAGARTDACLRLAYVENMQATLDPKGLSALGEENYIAWLERFEYMDILAAGQTALELWSGQSATLSKPKNAEAEEAEG